MSRKNVKTTISIPVWQIIATALLLYLLPPPESMEKFLLFSLKYKQSVLAVKVLLLAIIVLIPFYLQQRASRPLNRKQRNDLLDNIKEMVEAQYSLHTRNELSKNFDKLTNNESSRGFSLPSGALNNEIINLYKKEFSIFGCILQNSIDSVISSINPKGLYSHLSSLIVDMFNSHNTRIKADYKKAADGYWNGKIGDVDLNKDFAKIADYETKLQIDKLLSKYNLNKIIT